MSDGLNIEALGNKLELPNHLYELLKGRVTTFGGEQPYGNASLTLMATDPSSELILSPVSKIYISPILRNAMKENPSLFEIIDIEGFPGTDALISPIIVEQSIIDNGKFVVVDGAKRLFLARELGIQNVTAIVVSAANPPYPFLGVPFNEVTMLMSTEPNYPNNRSYRRMLSSPSIVGNPFRHDRDFSALGSQRRAPGNLFES